MNQNVVPLSSSILPAPMSPALYTRVQVFLNKLDQAGSGHTIAADDAPDSDTWAAMKRRSERLEACLMPAGELFVAKLIANLSTMKKRTRSEREAEVAMRQLVDGLADLPVFALEQAAKDFRDGSYGDGWFPDLSDIRPRALVKLQPIATEKRLLDKVLNAKVREGGSDPNRKARLLVIARQSVQAMPLAGQKAEADRAGRSFDTKPPETPQQALARLAAERDIQLPNLSPEAQARAPFHVPDMREEEVPRG